MMIIPTWFVVGCFGFLLTYMMHSTVIISIIAITASKLRGLQHPALRVLSWKLAIVLPLVTTVIVTVIPALHLGYQFQFSDRTNQSAGTTIQTLTAERSEPPLSSEIYSQQLFNLEQDLPSEQHRPANHVHSTVFSASSLSWETVARLVTCMWIGAVLISLARLVMQIRCVRSLTGHATVVESLDVQITLQRIARKLRVRQKVKLLETNHVDGALTAGIWRPFILVQKQKLPGQYCSHVDSEWRALLAHELAHIAHQDAKWNLLTRLVQCLFPFQILNRTAARQLQIAMDFAADESAVRALGDQDGLIACLIHMGNQLLDRRMIGVRRSGLVASVAAFRSTLGRRVERLLVQELFGQEISGSARIKLLTCFTVLALTIASLIPRGIAEYPYATSQTLNFANQGNSMRSQLSALAILLGLSAPVAGDDRPNQLPGQSIAELKSTPDELPAGIKRFNGMLVGRLAAKDVEQGSFVVVVDAVPRVWQNSRAENPKSIIGKAVKIEGVFGKFLDVLVTTRQGETIEFECKNDGDSLVFPGELLRKVAPYKAEDYPVLPETFRGFRGAVIAEVKSKDPETFELIVSVTKITDVWKESGAKQPESIVGKEMMLAGFWNRKDAYHKLKVGDRIEVGMQHIGRQSDHLTVAEYVRTGDQEQMRDMQDDAPVMERSGDPMQGFRGMLVGRLVRKDVERGTFTVTVDAIPRVWNNNKSRAPKSLLGKNVDMEGVPTGLLDALVVTRIGETLQFGALHDGGDTLRVGEVLRKVAPVQKGDYPELPDDFRGFNGTLQAKIVKKDEQLWELTAQVSRIVKGSPKDRSRNSESIIGKQVMLTGFWNRKDAYHDLTVGDSIEVSVEHPQLLGDQLSVVEGIRKLDR